MPAWVWRDARNFQFIPLPNFKGVPVCGSQPGGGPSFFPGPL